MIDDDRGVADALYTVLSTGIVILAGLAIAGVVLDVVGHQGKAAADQLSVLGAPGLKKGLYALYYTIGSSPDLSSDDPNMIPPGDFIAERTDPSIALSATNLPVSSPAAGGVVIWVGFILVQEPGRYVFELESTDGSWLWVNGALVADNHGCHPAAAVSSAPVQLTEGCHQVKARYFYTDAANASCKVQWSSGGPWSQPTYCR